MIKTPLSTMIGGAFWTPGATIIGGASKTFNQLIKSLFANNEQGFAYDPNVLSTMYQDAAGTVPVTAAGQPVGLILDKSKGFVLGEELAGANGAWADDGGTGWSRTGTVYKKISGAVGGLFLNKPVVETNNKWFKFKVTIVLRAGNIGVFRNNNRYRSLSTVGTTTLEFIFRPSEGATNPRLVDLFAQPSFDGDVDISLTSLQEIQGNHAYQTVSASRPILQRNAITGAYYLAFDGADDFLVTNSIDFTATDEVSLFAGVRKLSDANTGIVVELSGNANGNNGAFYLATAINAPASEQWFTSRGTSVASVTLGTNAAAYSAVYTAKASILPSSVNTRRNGISMGTSVVSQGTGNHGTYPLYIGRREGKFFSLNGHLYSLVGIARLTTDSETIALEKSIAKNTGVTLSV